MPLRLLSGVTLRDPWTQDIRGEPGKVCKSSTVRACAVFLRMPVGVTCQWLAGFGGDRVGHAAKAPSLTVCQLTAGVGLGVPRLPATPLESFTPWDSPGIQQRNWRLDGNEARLSGVSSLFLSYHGTSCFYVFDGRKDFF
jgi:hypothetical protein